MLPAFLVLGAWWIVLQRQSREPWPDIIRSLLMLLAIFGAIAWLLPDWVARVALLGYVGMAWWMVPVNVWRSSRSPMRSGTVLYDPGRHPVRPELRDAVERQAEALAAAGLERRAVFWSWDPRGVTLLQVMMETPDGLEGVMVNGQSSALEGRPNDEGPWMVGGAYGVRFAEDRGLLVVNVRNVDPVPGIRVECFPSVHGLVQLLAVGRAYRRRFLADARPVPGRDGLPPLEAYEARELRGWRAQVRSGRYRLLPDGHVGLSLLGSVAATLALQMPFRQIAGLRARMRERRLLRTLGFAPPPPERERWWLHPVDLTGAAVMAMVVALLIPSHALPAFTAPFAGARVSGLSAVRVARPYRLPEGFAVPADFPGAVRALERLAGAAAAPMEVEDERTLQPRRGDGFEVPFAADRADSLIARAGPLFRARGFLLFRHEYTFGIGGEPERVALHPRDDPAEVMRLVATSGANFGIETDSVVAWFGRLNARHPFVLTGVGHDYVQARFVRRPTAREARTLARELYDFCPDVVQQGTGDLRKLAEELETGVVYCWWD